MENTKINLLVKIMLYRLDMSTINSKSISIMTGFYVIKCYPYLIKKIPFVFHIS